MIDTVRERIIQAFIYRAESLGFMDVFRCLRSMPVEKEPSLSIWDGVSYIDSMAYGIENKRFQIGVEMAFISKDHSYEANQYMGMIEAGFGDGDKTFGGLVGQLRWSSSQPSYPDDGSLVSTVRVTYDVYFSTPVGDPYSVAKIKQN